DPRGVAPATWLSLTPKALERLRRTDKRVVRATRFPACAPALRGDQVPQRREVDHVELGPLLESLGRFEIHRDLAKPAVVEQESERLEPQVAAPYVLVPVDARAELLLAVVEMKGLHQLHAHRLVEGFHGGFVIFLGPQRVAGGERVAGVDAHA